MEGFARLLLGLIAAALVLSYLNNGAGGPRAWLNAKFLGKAG